MCSFHWKLLKNNEYQAITMRYSPIALLVVLLLWTARLQGQCSYFQQEVNYQIDVTLNDADHSLSGRIAIEYINHSPDTLHFLFFHLWPNAFQNRNTAFARQQLAGVSTRFYFANDSKLGGLSGLDFKADGQQLEWRPDPQDPDIAYLPLPAPLASGQKVVISTPFKLKIPASFSRLGHVGQSYQMTQWFPKPAVYDCEGWHPMPYLDMGEFYSEFGHFDVRITLPRNYVVGATGVLQTESEKAFLLQKSKETLAAYDALNEDGEARDTFPPSSPEMKTIHYKADKVHDFAWFADKRFNVIKGEVALASGRKVDTWVMFTRTEQQLWRDAINYVNRSVRFYSDHVGEYPWPQATAVQSALSAGGGMEYPMITVISLSGDAPSLDEVITHEVGHNWFYGVLASNERDHPWMDEGINSYYEERYMHQYYAGRGLDQDAVPGFLLGGSRASFSEMAYLFQARRRLDQAPETSSNDLARTNYFLGAYAKPAMAFKYLEQYLGVEKFDEVMQDYYRQWQFKHPQPDDLRRHIESATGKNLGWLFEGLIGSNRQTNYAIGRVRQRGDSLLINLRNRGELAGPLPVVLVKDSAALVTKWIEGFEGKQTIALPAGDYDQIAIDPNRFTLDVYRKNNYLRTQGLLRHCEPLKIRWAPGPENDRRTELFVLPVFAWNNYDKMMLGLALFNHSIFKRRFEWEFAPMYASNTRSLSGVGRIQYHIFTNHKIIKRLSAGAGLRAYHYDDNPRWNYNLQLLRITPFLRLEFNKKPAGNFYQYLEWRTLFINKEDAQFDSNTGIYTHNKWFTSTIHELSYSAENRRVLHPFAYKIAVEQRSYPDNGGDQHYLKASLEWRNSFTYAPRRSIDVRIFAGGFLQNTRRNAGAVYPGAFNLASRGYNDYRYDDYYLARNEDEGLFSQQIALRDGGFKTVFHSGFSLGRSNNYLIAVNLKASLPKDLPLKLPLKPYFDIGYYDNAMPTGQDDTFGQQVLWSGGLMFDFMDGVAGIYFPLVNSKNISNLNAERGNYFTRISFSVDLQRLDPWNVIDKLRF